jgi:hypothetical protein
VALEAARASLPLGPRHYLVTRMPTPAFREEMSSHLMQPRPEGEVRRRALGHLEGGAWPELAVSYKSIAELMYQLNR